MNIPIEIRELTYQDTAYAEQNGTLFITWVWPDGTWIQTEFSLS